jgi:hypothetical protein
MRRREIDVIHDAVVIAAQEIHGRPQDGAFRESILRDALRDQFAGAKTEVKLGLLGWSSSLGGVDIEFRIPDGHTVAIETKVWDIEYALYDLFKLAAGVQQHRLSSGYLVIAALARQWHGSGIVVAMSTSHPASAATEWTTEEVLEAEGERWRKQFARAAVHPKWLPARFVTVAAPSVVMPHAIDHEIRVIGVKAVGNDEVRISEDGTIPSAAPGTAGAEHARDTDADDAVFQQSLRQGSPAMRIFYSHATPAEKLVMLGDLRDVRPDLAAEIEGYCESAAMQVAAQDT